MQPHSCANSPDKNAALLLPSVEDDKAMRNLFVTHVSRILTTHMKYFKLTFDDVVDWHHVHEYYEEMSEKSSVVSSNMDCTLNVLQVIALIQVPLGVLLENENSNDGMLNILQHFHQYTVITLYICMS